MSDKGEKASWLEPLPEEYITEGEVTGRRMLVAALTVIILAIFGGLIWYSYLDGTENGPVPVVRADNSVVKEKPDTPGGLQVPDQDKRVFVRVASDVADESEKLAPSTELPIERPVKIVVAETETETEEIPAEQPAQIKTPAQTKNIAPVEEKTGTLFIQLGAFGKKDTAEKLWDSLQTDNPSLLKGLTLDIMMIDLGKKGVLYRLRGGMIADRSSADKICDGLRAKKQACIVVTK